MKAKRVSSQIFIDKSKPLSRLTHPISPVKEDTDLLQPLKTPTQEWNCVKVNGPRETVCRLSKSPSYDLIWRGTQMETLQARLDDLSLALLRNSWGQLVASLDSLFLAFFTRFFKFPFLLRQIILKRSGKSQSKTYFWRIGFKKEALKIKFIWPYRQIRSVTTHACR